MSQRPHYRQIAKEQSCYFYYYVLVRVLLISCNSNDYSVTCSKQSLVYFLCQLADRPEQDFSLFLFLLFLPKKFIIDFFFDVCGISFFIRILFYFFIKNNCYTDNLYHYVYLRIHFHCCTVHCINTSPLMHYTLHQIRNHHTHIRLHSSHKQTMNTK